MKQIPILWNAHGREYKSNIILMLQRNLLALRKRRPRNGFQLKHGPKYKQEEREEKMFNKLLRQVKRTQQEQKKKIERSETECQ